MTDIVKRLRFDAARCELQFSKGVAGNIEEAADEIERLTAALDIARTALLNIEWKSEEARANLTRVHERAADGEKK